MSASGPSHEPPPRRRPGTWRGLVGRRLSGSLAVKIGAAILAVQALTFALLGAYYGHRFAGVEEEAARERTLLPGRLMAQGILRYDSVNDPALMRDLVGDDIAEAAIISMEGVVFHAMDPAHLGRDLADIPRMDPAWFAPDIASPLYLTGVDEAGRYRAAITVLTKIDGKTPFLYAFVKTRTQATEALKTSLWTFFLAGSLIGVGLTTALLALMFRRMVFTPVNQCLGVLADIKAGRLNARLPLPHADPDRLDEMGRLKAGVNATAEALQGMVDNLSREVQRRRRTEDALTRANEDLEQRVAERTANLRQEVAERRAAEQRIRESTELIRGILEHSTTPIYVKGLDGRYLMANQALAATLGFTPEEMEGLRPHDFLPLDMADVVKAQDEEVVRSGRHRIFENTYDYGGGTHTLLTVKFPLRDAAGRVFAVCGMSTDITERKRMEERLQEATRAKSRFLANMSHEIRTPISGIMGLTEMLLESPQARQDPENLRRIHEAASLLIRLVDDILDMTRIEAGKLEFSREPFDLRHRLESALAPLRRQAEAKGLDFALRVDPDLPPTLVGDPDRLVQMCVNLAGNAVKFTDQGGVEVDAAAARDVVLPDGELRLRVTVADSGRGIDAARVHELFERFEQGDLSTSKRHGGVGLGLAITKALAEGMGGTVGAAPREDGPGAVFRLDLPLRLPLAEERVDGDLDTPRTDGRSLADFTGVRVLLAEDNEVNRLYLEYLLRRLDMRVTSASNGREAVELFEAGDFDIILMDVQMPEMDGLEALRRIRAGKRNPAVPVLALTAYAMAGDRERFLEAGMDAYVTKPVNRQALLAAMAGLLPGLPKELGAQPDVFQPVDRAAQEDGFALRGPEAAASEGNMGGADMTAVRELYGDDTGVWLRLCESFTRRTGPRQLAALRQALRDGDFQALARASHGLKGDAGAVCALGIAAMASRLNEAARLAETAGVSEGIKAGDMAWARAQVEAIARALEAFGGACPEAESAGGAEGGPDG